MDKFKVGDIVMPLAGNYKGKKVEITDFHPGHNPLLYSVKVLAGPEAKGAFREDELETVYEHDVRLGPSLHAARMIRELVEKQEKKYRDIQLTPREIYDTLQ